MEMRRADLGSVDPAVVDEASSVLMGGGILGMRTDTVYGLLVSANRRDALSRLAELKSRPAEKPFPLLAADWIGVRSVTSSLPTRARVLGQRHWPGALTLVLPAAPDLPREVVGPGSTVAVRIPGDALARAIAHAARGAVAAPSANRAGEDPARTADRVRELFEGRIDFLIDGGEVGEGVRPSTIVRCSEAHVEVLREGQVRLSAEELGNGRHS